jgi:hypothetical protein
MIALTLAAVLAAATPTPSPPGPALRAEAVRPGALAFGSPERKATAALGPPTRSWAKQGFQWRQYAHGSATVALAFYRDKLGIVDVRPAAPMAWPETKAWLCAFAPGFDAAKLHKEPTAWTYFQAVGLEGVPFEIELRLSRVGDRTAALHGEMHWLD